MWKKLWASAPATVLIALLAFVALVAMPTMAAAAPRPLLTIADGPVQVLRGSQRLAAVEGMALADEDIVRTTAATRVARIEWADGRVLDLGPASEVMLASARVTRRSAEFTDSTAVLARGWVKLSAGADAAMHLAAPGAVVHTEARGVLLLHADADGALVAFAESRAASIAPRGAGSASALREGQAWARAGAAAAGAVVPRGASLGDVPRALADALPRRAARFAEREAAPSAGEALDADDLAAWWRAEPALMALVHPRSAAGASKKKSTPLRIAVAAPKAAKPKARSAAPRVAKAPPPVVVPGLPLPAAGGESEPSAFALGGSTRLAAERIGAAALPAITPAPALPPAPAVAATTPPRRY